MSFRLFGGRRQRARPRHPDLPRDAKAVPAAQGAGPTGFYRTKKGRYYVDASTFRDVAPGDPVIFRLPRNATPDLREPYLQEVFLGTGEFSHKAVEVGRPFTGTRTDRLKHRMFGRRRGGLSRIGAAAGGGSPARGGGA